MKDDLPSRFGACVAVLREGALDDWRLRAACMTVMQGKDELSDDTPHQLLRQEFPIFRNLVWWASYPVFLQCFITEPRSPL